MSLQSSASTVLLRDLCGILVDNHAFNKSLIPLIIEKASNEDISFSELLIKDDLANEEQFANACATLFGFEYLNIDKIAIDENIVKTLTFDFISKYKFIPLAFDQSSNRYIVILSNPFDPNALRLIYAMFGYDALIVVTTSSKLVRIQARVFSKNEIYQTIQDYNKQEAVEEAISANALSVDFENADLINSPAVRLVDSCLNDAVAVGASDIHIEPYENIVRIRYRIDGVLYENTAFSTKLFPAVVTRIKIISKLNIAERRIPQDGRISKVYNGVPYDFRVSTLPTTFGEKIVIRVLDTNSFNFDRSKLGFLPQENLIVDELLKKPYGIILLTGPTGCGKSTTLYSFIKEINKPDVNIITVEDPVEYSIPGINQVQVNNKANLTFATALRSILRQDPNIVMIGEIRDEETAEIAMRMAITGHLVFSTLHTNDASGAVTRLIDLGLQPYFVSDALVGVISQRLVRRLCPECKVAYMSSKTENEVLHLSRSRKIFKPCGCPACHNTGYKGRLGVHEILKLSDSLKELIVTNATTQQIRDLALQEGMLDLFATCKEAVLSGQTSVAEFLSILYNK